MSKKIEEALNNYINGNVDKAHNLLKEAYIEIAKVIMENQEHIEDEDSISVEINGNPTNDLTTEISYPLAENSDEVDTSSENGEEKVEETPEINISDTQFEELEGKIDELKALFDEINNGSNDIEDIQQEDEFDGIQFGDDELEESFQMKDIPDAKKTEEGGQRKSPVANSAKSLIDSAKPVKSKSNSTFKEDPKETDEGTDFEVKGKSNVMNSDKELMNNIPEPENNPSSSQSPVARDRKL